MVRRFQARRTWRFWIGWIVLVAIAVRIVYLSHYADPPRNLTEGEYQVKYVIDGDTLVLDDGKKIRLIGVDTPETHLPDKPPERWGREATQFAQGFVNRANGRLQLQFDNERLDVYNRHLAYVWAGDKMLNEELLREGLARFRPRFRYSETMKRRFRTAEREAKSQNIGIWSDNPATSH